MKTADPPVSRNSTTQRDVTQDPATTRIMGTYRGDPAILNYSASTAQVVVQAPDGIFISGWQMSPAQLQNVIERGSLGGG